MLFTLAYVAFAIGATHAALFSRPPFAALLGSGMLSGLLDGALVLLHTFYWFFLIYLIYKGFDSIA